jgi:alpha-methylacyl-CoA racemase
MGPLNGVRVVQIDSLAPAPFGCMIMADLGADVLRVDRAGGTVGVTMPAGVLDRGQRTIAVDLKDPDGVALVRRLATEADVFVEGFRPGVAERLGIGPDELTAANPRLIYARMTGWGQGGPFAARAGHDINYISIAGALEPIGRADSPVPPLNLVADFAGGGLLMTMGVLAALHERSSSGKGQVVDAAMVDGSALLMSATYALHSGGLWNEQRANNMFDGAAAFYDSYATSDGKFVAVGALEPQFFAELVDKLGIADERLPPHLEPTGWPAIRTRLSEIFRTKTRDEWSAIFFESDACVTPILSPWEAADHPANKERGTFFELDGIVQPSPAPRFSRTPAPTPRRADDGGRDVRASLTDWGLSADEVEKLIAAQTVS